MSEEKALEITDCMIASFDQHIKEIDNQMYEERTNIKRHTHRLEILDYMRGRAETTRTIMVEHQKGLFRQEEV